jgi:hypothetical protein
VDNPVDAIIKELPNKALQHLVNYNELTICIDGFVDCDGFSNRDSFDDYNYLKA